MASKEIRDIDNYILLHGHKNLTELFELDNDLLDYVKEIALLDLPEFKGTQIPYISRQTMKNNSKNFASSILSFRDVGFLSDKKLKELLTKYEITSVKELIYLYNSSPVFISPFKIPIEYSHDCLFSGTLDTQVLITEQQKLYKKLLPKLNLYFTKIVLAKGVTDIASSCYLHELMHTQLERHKGIIDNYYNSEVFSIFIELLYAFENNNISYMLILTCRINNLLLNFNSMYLFQTDQPQDREYTKFDYVVDGKYLLSTMKAFNLLEKYIYGTKGIKREILKQMQKVIDGEKKVEEFLKKFEIDYNNSRNPDITRNLILK